MSRVIRYREREHKTVYSMVFPHDPNATNYPPRGGWYGFDADENGFVDRDALNPTARENFDYCCLMRPWGWLESWQEEYTVPGLMKCDCGGELEMWRPGADIHCKCGRSYTSSGQLLALRSQWGEETGETAADYDRGYNDPEHAFDE